MVDAGERSQPRILLVEDEALIALDMQDILEEAGYAVVGPADRVGSALALAESEMLDAALLDVNLDGEKVWPVAEALRKRDIPFVLLTGSPSGQEQSPGTVRAPQLSKPVQQPALLEAISAVLREAERRKKP